jgi:hypothetical protein
MAEPKANRWTDIPSQETIDAMVSAMKARGFNVVVTKTKGEALQTLKTLIPAGAELMTGSSTSLNQVGFMEYYLSGKTPWKCLGPLVYNEKDPTKQLELRRKSIASDYFIASVNAIAETGELVACDRSGSRVSAYPFAAGKVILLVGIQKTCTNLAMAMQRVREHVFPLEDARARKAYGTGSAFGKWVIVENEFAKGRITVVLCTEPIGF